MSLGPTEAGVDFDMEKFSGKIKVEYKSARWVQDANEDNFYTVGEVLDMIKFFGKISL